MNTTQSFHKDLQENAASKAIATASHSTRRYDWRWAVDGHSGMAGVMRLTRFCFVMYVSKNEIRVACADTASADPLFALSIATHVIGVLTRFISTEGRD